MAAILGVLAVAYVAVNMLVFKRTSDGQADVERYHSESTAASATCSATSRSCRASRGSRAEMKAMRI